MNGSESKENLIGREKFEKVIKEYLVRMTDKKYQRSTTDYHMDCPACGMDRCLVSDTMRKFWHCLYSGCGFNLGAQFPEGMNPPSPSEIFELLEQKEKENRRQEIEHLFRNLAVPF